MEGYKFHQENEDAGDDRSQLDKLKYEIDKNLKIKQAFLNFILALMNNFLACETYLLPDQGKLYNSESIFYIDEANYEPNFDENLYLKNISTEYHPFYKRFLSTQIFQTFLKDYHSNTSLKANEFKRYYDVCFKAHTGHSKQRDSV